MTNERKNNLMERWRAGEDLMNAPDLEKEEQYFFYNLEADRITILLEMMTSVIKSCKALENLIEEETDEKGE